VALFRRLDEVAASPEAILASNTSSIPIMKLAVATQRPSHVLGVHFFNPVQVLSLVELVPSLLTAKKTTEAPRTFVEGTLGKHAIDCQDRAGLVVNALLIPFILSAVRMLESGFATAEDIDQGLVRGAAHPQGPLALADLIGLDTIRAVRWSSHPGAPATDHCAHRPPPAQALRRQPRTMASAGGPGQVPDGAHDAGVTDAAGGLGAGLGRSARRPGSLLTQDPTDRLDRGPRTSECR